MVRCAPVLVGRGQSDNGRIYGIGSIQYRDFNPTETAPGAIQCNLDMDMRISGLEKNYEVVNANVEMVKADMLTLKDDMVALKSEFKDEMAATRALLNVILQALGVNSTTLNQVNHTQPSVPAAMTINPTQNSTMPTATTPPMTQARQDELDAWCATTLDTTP